MTEPMPTYSTPDGAPKSSPTATAAGTGNGASEAPTAAPATEAPLPVFPEAKSARRNTGKGRSADRIGLEMPELLQIFQQAAFNLALAGLPVSLLPLPADPEGRPQVAVILANVAFSTGNLVLTNTGNTGTPEEQ